MTEHDQKQLGAILLEHCRYFARFDKLHEFSCHAFFNQFLGVERLIAYGKSANCNNGAIQ